MSRTRVIVAAALLLLTLTGCEGILYSTYHDQEREGGVTPEAAEATLESIEGISAADYETVPWDQNGEGGLGASAGMNVVLKVTIDPQWSIAEPAEFLRYLGATAWSVNNHYPDGQVIIVITGGISALTDWVPIAAEAFEIPDLDWVGYVGYGGVEESVGTGMPVAIDTGRYGKTFGRWPSEPVPAPDSLLLDEPFEVVPVPAIANPKLYEIAMGGECLWVLFERGLGDAGTYQGEVTVALLAPDGTALGTRVVEGTETVADFCFDPGTRPARSSAVLSTEQVVGFDIVLERVESR